MDAASENLAASYPQCCKLTLKAALHLSSGRAIARHAACSTARGQLDICNIGNKSEQRAKDSTIRWSFPGHVHQNDSD